MSERPVMTETEAAQREVTEAEVQAAFRVLQNWGGLRDREADASAIVKTMLMAAAKARRNVQGERHL